MPRLHYNVDPTFHFEGGAPYFADPYPDLSDKAVRIFFKYNNDNNPFKIATITPKVMVDGLSMMGGYIKIFGLVQIALYFYNKMSFEKRIFRQYRAQIVNIYLDDQEHDEGAPLAKKRTMVRQRPSDLNDSDYFEQPIDVDRTPLKEYLKARGQREIDIKTVRDMLSYEMLMLIVI